MKPFARNHRNGWSTFDSSLAAECQHASVWEILLGLDRAPTFWLLESLTLFATMLRFLCLPVSHS